MIHHLERASGVHPKLQALAVYLGSTLPFDIGIPVDGGLRVDEALQAEIFARGNSGAATLDDTPHGCGCGIDIVPYDVSVRDFYWSDDGKNQAIADAIEGAGFTSGRNFPTPDPTHAEIVDWRSVRDSWKAAVGVNPSTGGALVSMLVGFVAIYAVVAAIAMIGALL